MAEFKDRVPHTGGVLTIRTGGGGYQLSYTHSNPHAMALVELLAVGAKPVEVVDLVSELSNAPTKPKLKIMLPTDSEGMYGRRCPECKSYFRATHPFTEMCPYCPAKRGAFEFFTDDQLSFIGQQYEAIWKALHGPDGDTTVNFDAQVAKPTSTQTWIYSEEKQQRHFECPSPCRSKFDVLGYYVRCPSCGKRTARDVIREKLQELSSTFEADAATMPQDTTAARDNRERRWRQHVASAVAETDAFGRHVADSLASLPATPSRKAGNAQTSLQSPIDAASKLNEWFGFDIFRGISQDDRIYIHRMFHRRHYPPRRKGRSGISRQHRRPDGASS